jgi:hypothetical protein
MTAEDAWAKKATSEAKRKAILEKKRQTLVRIIWNKIKIQWKTQGITARRQERERKKRLLRLYRRPISSYQLRCFRLFLTRSSQLLKLTLIYNFKRR